MSREYRVWVSATVRPGLQHLVEEALEGVWPFVVRTHPWEGQVEVEAVGDGSLGSGQPFERFARDLRRVVWTFAGEYVDLSVRAVCLEDPEVYPGSEWEYTLDRDRGLLCRMCEGCGDLLPFGDHGAQCQSCRVRAAQ